MANLVGICADTPAEKQAFLSRLGERLTPFEGLSTGRADWGTASLAWVAPLGAPVRLRQGPEGPVFSLGDSEDDAYFLSVSEDAQGTVTLNAGSLGFFPLYYYSTPDVFIFSTTPSVFKSYPGFRAELSVKGLVGILLVNFMTGGQTLLKGVRRLSAGHALRWRKGSEAKEAASDPVRPSDRYFGHSFEKNLEILDDCFSAAVKKSAGDAEAVTLLSGGLDSRLLAGYLSLNYGTRVRALTQGSAGDLEMQCAGRVARALGWTHRTRAVDPETFETCARMKIEHEHLAHGFNTPYFMQLVPEVRRLGSRIYSGLHGDAALGCGTMSRLSDPTGVYPFGRYFEHLNHSGFPVETLRRLIPKDLLGSAVEETIEGMKDLYDAYPGLGFQRAWLYELMVADRLQVGFIGRVLAFGAWPVTPFVDKALLAAVAGMPYGHIAHRRMEREIVCRKFPGLAVLPLDRNNYDTSPVFGLRGLFRKNNLSAAHVCMLVSERARGKVRAWMRRNLGSKTKIDRRFYYQTFDINGEAWRAFRRRVEPRRRLLENFFDAKTLSELWPGPSVTIRVKNGITDTQALKVLLGFAVWAEQNL